MSNSKVSGRDWTPQIDIHCHILPAWDDGPADLEKSLAMIQRAIDSGLKTIVATPHVGRKFHGVEKPAAEIAAGVASLQSEIAARGLDIQILTGAEVMLGEVDVRVRVPAERELTYAGKGKFCLVESPFPKWPPFGRSLVDALLSAGITPVLAHPERYVDVQKDLGVIEPVVKQGALVQLTADALMGAMGKPMQNTSRQMLQRGWVSFVASDAHSTRETLPVETIDEVVKIVGEDGARQIFVDNPQNLLEGKRVFPASCDQPASKGFLGRLLGR